MSGSCEAAAQLAETPKKFVTIKEATRMGYGSRNTLRRRIDEGVLPAYRFGRTIKFKPEDLDLLAKRIVSRVGDCHE